MFDVVLEELLLTDVAPCPAQEGRGGRGGSGDDLLRLRIGRRQRAAQEEQGQGGRLPDDHDRCNPISILPSPHPPGLWQGYILGDF